MLPHIWRMLWPKKISLLQVVRCSWQNISSNGGWHEVVNEYLNTGPYIEVRRYKHLIRGKSHQVFWTDLLWSMYFFGKRPLTFEVIVLPHVSVVIHLKHSSVAYKDVWFWHILITKYLVAMSIRILGRDNSFFIWPVI